MLSEDDSSSQVYIRLHGDGTYIIKDAKSIERGRWKNIDYDIFITYFYPTYLNSLFRTGAVGETVMHSPLHDPNTIVFSGLTLYGDGELSDDSFDQLLFCQQDKVLTKDDLKEVLKTIYGSNSNTYRVNE